MSQPHIIDHEPGVQFELPFEQEPVSLIIMSDKYGGREKPRRVAPLAPHFHSNSLRKRTIHES